jgi:hypothetical protein
LRVQARDEKLVREVASEKKAREDAITPEMRQTDLRQREITRLWRMTDDAVKKEESYMGEKSKDAYFKKFGLARSPWELKTSEAKYFSKYGVKYPWEPGKEWVMSENGKTR